MRTLLYLTYLAAALHANEGRMCSEGTIKGTYGYTLTASVPASPTPGAPIVQGVGVGVRIFDGRGNFTQVDSRKVASLPAVIDEPAFGTYKINPDCTGTAFLTSPNAPAPAEFRLVVVKKGKEIYWILVNPPAGPAVLGHGIRQ